MLWSWKNDEFQGKLEVWHTNSEGVENLKKEWRRGDFVKSSEIWRARRWVWTRTKELRREFLNSPEGAGIKAANAAWVSAWTAIVALLISVLAMGISWLAYNKPDSIQKVQLQFDVPITSVQSNNFPLPGNGIECQDWVVAFNLKPAMKEKSHV